MGPLSFDHEPGWIAARFSHDTFDYINLDIHLVGGLTITRPYDKDTGTAGEPEYRRSGCADFQVYFSSLWCAFGDFVKFLEAIAHGVQQCSFCWDPEGPHGAMSWRRSRQGTGILGIQWHSGGERLEYETLVRAPQAVRALYGAFRTFVKSASYDPFKYEALTVREAVALTLDGASVGELVTALSRLSPEQADEAQGRMLGFMTGEQRRWRLADILEGLAPASAGEAAQADPEWDSERGLWADRQLDVGMGNCWHGANLRALRSPLIEQWLEQQPVEPACRSQPAK